MSARDEALDLLEKILPREHAKAYRDLFSRRFDAFAHELAEQIRADIIPELDEYGTREQQAEIDGRRGAADLIDPQRSVGPECPDEEPTP